MKKPKNGERTNKMETVLKISMDSRDAQVALDALRAPADRTSAAFEKISESLKKLEQLMLNSLGGGAKKAATETQEAYGRIQEKNKQLQENFYSTYEKVKKSTKDVASQTKASFLSMESASESLLRKVTGLGGALAGGFGFTALLKSAGDFEKQMNVVAAISDLNLDVSADVESLKQLSAAARKAGQETEFTALDAAKALEYEASAGWSLQEQMTGLRPIIQGSVSTNTDLATTAMMVTDGLKAFGLPVTEATSYIDKLAKVASISSTNFAQLGEGTKYAGAAFNLAHQSAATMATVLGIVSDSGVKAGSAGMNSAMAISMLVNPSRLASRMMNNLGFSLSDSKGKIKDFVQVSEELYQAMQGFSEIDKAKMMFKIFGQEGARAMTPVLAQAKLYTDQQGKMTSALREYRERVINSTGTTEMMSHTIGKGLVPALGKARGAITEVGLKITDEILPAVTNVVIAFTNFVNAISPSMGIVAPLLEIIGVGGGLVLGMSALSAATTLAAGASTAFGMAVLSFSAAAGPGASAITIMNTSLYGTTVSAELAAGAMSKLKVAGSLMFAAWAGYEIGSYLFNEFEFVRNSGYELVGSLEKGFLSVQYYTEVTGVVIKSVFTGAIEDATDAFAIGNAAIEKGVLGISSTFSLLSEIASNIFSNMLSWIQSKVGGMLEGIASAMSHVDFLPGVSGISEKLASVSSSLKSNSETIDSFSSSAKESINSVSQEYEKQIKIIDKNKEAMLSTGGKNNSQELAGKISNLTQELEKNKQAVSSNIEELQTFNGASVQAAGTVKNTATEAKKAVVETENVTKSLAGFKSAEKAAKDAKINARKEETESKKIAREQEAAARKAEAEENKQAKAEIDDLKDSLNAQAEQINNTATGYREAAKALGEHINELKKFHSSLTEAQNALVTSGMTEYEKELYVGVKELGTEYGAQVAIVKNLAKAQAELTSIQLEQKKISVKGDMQSLRGQGVSQEDIDREVKYKQLRIDLSQKYTKVVVEELVQQQRFLDASKEQAEVQKKVADSQQLVNESALNDKQREYVKLMREVGVENAKQIVQNQELAASRSKGASTLASLQEERKLLQMTSEEQKRYNAIKDAAPEQYDAITQQMELNKAIQASKDRLDEAGKIAGSYFEKFVSGSMSGKEALKGMAGEVSAFASKELFKAARDQLQGLAGKKSNAELVGNVVDDNLTKATKWFDENTAKVVTKSQDFSGTIARAVDEAGQKLSTSINGFATKINDAIVQQKTYEQQADALDKAAQAMKDSAGQIGDAAKDISASVAGGGMTSSISSGSHRLGFLSEKYEVGKGGAATISTGVGDKGGKSYGSWQLASKVGTLGAFINSAEASPFASMLKSAKLASAEFDGIWKNIAKTQAKAFEGAQHAFIKRTHYDPAAQIAASKGFDMSNDAIKNMIWSGSVQHGGVKKIIANVAKYHQSALGDVDSTIRAFYEERAKYAAKHHKGLQQRYNNESKDAIAYAATLKKGGGSISDGAKELTKSVEKVDKAVLSVKPPIETVSNTSKVLANTQVQAVDAQKAMAQKVQAIQQQKAEVDQKDLVSSSAHNEAMAAVNTQRQTATIKDAEVIVVHAQATEKGAAAIANVAAMNPGIVASPQGGLGGLTNAISGVFQKGMFETGGLLGGASSLFGMDKIDSIMAGGGLSSIFGGDLGEISKNIGGIAGSLGGTQALGIGMDLVSGKFENAAVDAAALAASMTPLGPLGGAAVKAFSSFAGVGAEWVKEAEWISVDIKGMSAEFKKGVRETKDSMIGGGTRTSYTDVSKEELEKLNEQFSTIRDSVEQLNDSLSGLDINIMKGMDDYQAHVEDREGLGAEVFAKSMQEAQKQMLTHAIENMQIAGVDNDATKSLQENVTNTVSDRISTMMGLFTDMTAKVDYNIEVANSTWNGDLDRILGQNEVNSKEYHDKLTSGLLEYVKGMDLGNMNVDEIQANLAKKTQAMFAAIGVTDIPQSTFDSLSQTLAGRINDAILFVQTGVSEFAVTEDTGFFSTLRGMAQTFEGSAEELKKFIDGMVGLKSTFKESGLSTNAVTETFIDAAGGLEKLSASAGVFKDKFISETEAQSLAVQDSLSGITKAVASADVVLPQTREGFAELVRGLSNAGAGSEEALAKLIGTADKFDIFYTAVEGFNQKFLKLPESFKPIGGSINSMVTELSKLGVSIPKTRQEFTSLATGLDVTDVAQSKLYTSLIALSPAVDTVFSSVELLGGGLSESQTKFLAYSSSLTDVTTIFNDLGMSIPNSVGEFNSLIQSIDLTSESGQELYSSLMSATPALNQLYDAAKQIVGIDVSNVSGALQKGIEAGNQGGDAGATFYSSFIDDIQSKFLSSTLSSVSTIIMDSVVTPMINASVQSATNMQIGGINTGNTLSMAGVNTANNLSQAGTVTAGNLAQSGAYTSQQIATGGNSASQSMIIGGRLSAEALASTVETVKQIMLVNSQVMEAIKGDKEFQAQMEGLGSTVFSSSTSFAPVAMPTATNTVSNADNSSSQIGDSVSSANDALKESKDAFDGLGLSIANLLTGLDGDDLKLHNLGEKYKNLSFAQDFVGISSQELAQRVSSISFEQMTDQLDGTDISVKDLSSDIQDYVGILGNQEKAEKERQDGVKKYNQDLSEQLATLQLSDKELKAYNDDNEYAKLIADTIAAGGDIAVAEQINAAKKKKVADEQLQAISDFERQYREQVEQIGKSSEQLDLEKIATDFEAALQQANELGADTILVTQAFEQQRADIIKKYADENSSAIESLQTNVVDLSTFKNVTKENQAVATAQNYGVDIGQAVVGSDIQGIINDAVNYSERQWIELMQSVGVAIDATNIGKFKDDLGGVATVALQLQSQFGSLQNSLELVAGTSDESTQKIMAIAKQFPGIGIAVDGNTVAIQGMVMTSKQAANDLLNVMKNPADFAKLASRVGIESQEDFMNAASSIIGAMGEMDTKADATKSVMKGLHEAMSDIRTPIEGAQKTLADLDSEFGGFVTSSNLFGRSATDVANAVDSIPIQTLTNVSAQYGISVDQLSSKIISGVQALNQIQGQVTSFQQQQQDAIQVASGMSENELVIEKLKEKYKEIPEIVAAISKEGLTSLDVQKFVTSKSTGDVANLSAVSGYSIESILEDVKNLEGALDGINSQSKEVSTATTDFKNSLKVMAGETNSTILSLDAFKDKYPDLIKALGLSGASVETLNHKLGGLSDNQFEEYAKKAGVATTELIGDMKSFADNTKTIGDQTAERTAKITGFIGDMDRTASTLDDVEYSMKKLGQTSPELVNYLQTLGKNSYEISASLASMDTAQVDNLTQIAAGMGYSLDRAIDESKNYINNLRSQEEKKAEAEKSAFEEQQKTAQEQQAAMEKANEEKQKAAQEQQDAIEKAAQEQQAAMEKAAQEQQATYEKQQDELMKQVDGLFSVFDKLADKISSVAEGLATSIKSFYSEDQLNQLTKTKLSSLKGEIFRPRAVVDVNQPDSTEQLLTNIDEYQKMFVESRKDEISNFEEARDIAKSSYNEGIAYYQKLHDSSSQILSDVSANIGEITKALGQADSATTTKQKLLADFVNEADFEKKLEIAKQIPPAIKAAMDEEIALDEKRIESAKAAREQQEKLNESIKKGLASSAGIREKISVTQDPITKFQTLMAKISPNMAASEENIQLIQDAQNAAYENYQAQIDSQKKLEDDRFNEAKKHSEEEKRGAEELRKQSESFLSMVESFRKQGKTDTRVLELDQSNFQNLLTKYRSGDTSSTTLDALKSAGTSYVQQGEKVYGSAQEQTGKGGIIDQVSAAFQEIGISLGQQANQKEANIPIDETVTGSNVFALKEIQERSALETLDQLTQLDTILNTMYSEPSPLPESQVEAIRTGANEQLGIFSEQMLILTEQLNPENQPKFDDSEFAAKISETQNATVAELQLLSQMTVQLDTELKNSLSLSLTGIYDRLSPENQAIVAARLETAIQRDITTPLRELGITFTNAVSSLGTSMAQLKSDVTSKIAADAADRVSANVAAAKTPLVQEQSAKSSLPATTRDPPLIVDRKTGKIVPVSAPRMAEGGIVTKPTYAYVGEGDESEAVIPLSKLPELLQKVGFDGKQTTNNDIQDLVKLLATMSSGNSNNQNTELLLKILDAINKLNAETKNGFKSQQRAIEERKIR